MKLYFALIAVSMLLSSCFKKSIADAMLDSSNGSKITATFSYEINGEPVQVSVKDADHQGIYPQLQCKKSNGYMLGCWTNDFVFTFYTDSLKVGNYQYTSAYRDTYVVTYPSTANYIAGPTDYMDVNITSYKNGHISGNFSGKLSPLVSQGMYGNTYGTYGLVVIKNGSFNNVPVVY
jgi:hypothetical protein